MSFNSTIGNSPFGYIYDLLESDMKEKNKRYSDGVVSLKYGVPREPWPNCWSLWEIEAEKYIQSEPKTAIIKGYPEAMERKGIPVNPNFYIYEQASPFYSKIIGAMLNKATVVLRAPYPTSPDGKHDEPFIVSKDGKLIGFWYKLDKFLDDYNPEKGCHFWLNIRTGEISYEPRVGENWREYKVDDYWKTNKPWIWVEIVSDLKSRKFEYQDLSKVLNP